ncbi:MAG: efflux RND transporter periplasmic adaptor subunit [Betaproteobacteria bacterium]|nr:efflux RND transporter periplasmic adaptor subunit [Betaproteobacteria bacterium]
MTALKAWMAQSWTQLKALRAADIVYFVRRHNRIFLAGVVVAVAAKFGIDAFLPEAAKKKPPTLVTTALVETRDMQVILESSGNIVAANIVDIRPQTTNTVSKIHIREGQTVRTGDLLFTLDDRADRANFEKAKALAEDAERQLKRAQDLFEKKFVSQAAIDTATTNLASARASAQAAEVALSYDHIRSPITGRAGVINVYPGSLVQVGNNVTTQTNATSTTTTGAMVTITQLNPINVQFTIPEKDLPLILGAREGEGELSVEVDVPGQTAPAQGKVFVVDNQIDPAIGAVRVRAQLANKEGLMIPGQFVRVRLKAKTLKAAATVPTQAIVINTNGTFLFVVGDANKVALKPVKVVYQYQETSVISGVEPQEKIVVEGKQNLRPGDTVVEPKKESKAPAQ